MKIKKKTIKLVGVLVCGHLHLFDILIQYKAPIHTADIHSAFPIHYASQLCGISENENEKIDLNKGRGKFRKTILTIFFFIDQVWEFYKNSSIEKWISIVLMDKNEHH